jgi:transketolase
VENDFSVLEKKASWVRRKVLDMCIAAGAGHIAPAFSCADILVALYQGGVLDINPGDLACKDRDRFILSKGQGCAALYAVLADKGFFPVSELNTYTQLGSRFGGHAESSVPGVEAFTGSLGHGLSIACGMALAAKMDKKDYKVITLLGDGECQEGSIWEAAMFAAHNKLKLFAIIDRNKLQAIDFTEQVFALEPFRAKWISFGWEVKEVNGHCFKDMISLFKEFNLNKQDKPLIVIAHTVKGKGVSFMENKPIWHYRIPTGAELQKAKKELGE